MKEIIEAIKKGYTGDNEKDTQYLLEQMDKYKDNQPVLKEIYKLLFELLPQDLQNNFVRNINTEKFAERLTEIQELVANKKYEKALNYLDMSIEHIDKVYEDDKYEYKTFHSPLEAYIYAKFRDDKTKIVKNAELDFGVFHKFRGIILYNLERYEEAEKEFLESFKWNNLDFEAIFAYADTLFKMGRIEEFYKYNLEKIKTCFSNYGLATIYHNLGLYYLTKGTKDDDMLAFYLICYSISFAETEYAFKDLNTICEKYKMKKELAPEDVVFRALNKRNIPLAPDPDLTKLLIDTARGFIGKNDEFALYTFKVIYSLTRDDITLQYIKAGEKAIAAKRKEK